MIILFEPEEGDTASQEAAVEEPALLEATLIVHRRLDVIAKVSVHALFVANVMLVLETFKYETGSIAAGCITNIVFDRVPDVITTQAYLAALVVLAVAAILTTILFKPVIGVTVSHAGRGVPGLVDIDVDIVIDQLTLDAIAKVSAQAL